MTIVGHVNPDWDCITAIWLLKRFGSLSDAEIRYVNTGYPDPTILNEATAVVDTGGIFDEKRLRFDHHHFPGSASNDTCAALQVYTLLVFQNPGIAYLDPLVRLIFEGDTGRTEANSSRELGLHAMLSGYKAWFSEKNPGVRLTDEAIMTYGFSLLDTLEVRLRNRAKAKAELVQKIVYKSADNLLWAIRYGSSGSSFAAFDEGARVVVFEGEPIEVDGGTTYPIGLMRAGEWQEPHCGKIIENVIANPVIPQPVVKEVSLWFRHNAGFFSGKGTTKAPHFEPPYCELEELAKWIDQEWKR